MVQTQDVALAAPAPPMTSMLKSKLSTAPTLLPAQLASLITAVSLASRISIRSSALFIEAILEGARFSTLAGLGLTRRALIAAISSARHLHYGQQSLDWNGRDADGNKSKDPFLRVLDQYTNIGCYFIHSVFSLAELFAMTGFSISMATISTGFSAAEDSVRILDQLFGSNESSRALSSIISLIKHELTKDPRYSVAERGLLASLAALTKSLTAFAVLQVATRKRTFKEMTLKVVYDCTVITQDEAIQTSAKRKIPDELGTPSSAAERVTMQANDSKATRWTGHVRRLSAPVNDDLSQRLSLLVNPDEADDSDDAELADTLASTVDFQTHSRRQSYTNLAGISSSGLEIQVEELTKTTVTTVRASTSDQDLAGVTSVRRHSITRQSTARDYTNESDWLNVPDRAREQDDTMYDDFLTTPSAPSRSQSASDLRTASAPNLHDEHDSAARQTEVPELKRKPPKVLRAMGKALKQANIKSAFSPPASRQRTPPESPVLSPVRERLPLPDNFRMTPREPQAMPAFRKSEQATFTPSPSKTHTRLRRLASSQSLRSIVTTCAQESARLEKLEASLYPQQHLAANLQRFMRFSSAAYGQSFLRILGIGRSDFSFPHTHVHANDHAFAHHVGLDVSDIILSSYSDSQQDFSTEKISPIVNYVAVDHSIQAVVLSCRGSLGLSDLLVDLTCDYETINLPHANNDTRSFYVHSGMFASATTLQRGTVHETIRDALEKYPSYGLVLCGHSLGGGVAALLSVLWSCPAQAFLDLATSFTRANGFHVEHPPVTTAFVTSMSSGLPPGRAISCYTYGPPCVASPDLARYCHGLVTSVVNNVDFIPTLSLGVLRDLKGLAMSLYAETGAAEEIIGRVIGLHRDRFTAGRQKPSTAAATNDPSSDESTSSEDEANARDTVVMSPRELGRGKSDNLVTRSTYTDPALLRPELSDDMDVNDRLWALMKTVRAGNDAEKLYPPGHVYCIESCTVFVRDSDTNAFSLSGAGKYSRKEGRRVILRQVENVEKRFSEPIFSRSMFSDHSPHNYESNLDLLASAVL